MADALSGFRQKMSRVAELANAVKRLHDTGIIDFANLGVIFIDELSRNATGKLLRRFLTEMDVDSSARAVLRA